MTENLDAKTRVATADAEQDALAVERETAFFEKLKEKLTRGRLVPRKSTIEPQETRAARLKRVRRRRARAARMVTNQKTWKKSHRHRSKAR